jgi:transcriptional regulator with XRE-family HTH domain
MSNHARENLMRLMASGGLSVRRVSSRTGVDERTIRGILNGDNKPHAQTLHRLANGLGVRVDEFFVNPAQLLFRCMDCQSNAIVTEALETNGDLFEGWTVADFHKLHERTGRGEPPTLEATLQSVRQMNENRGLHDILAVLLESSEAEVTAGILNVLRGNVRTDPCADG